MRVVDNKGRVGEDAWQVAVAGQELPPSGDVVVSLEVWNDGTEALLERAGRVGVLLRGDESPEQISRLKELPLIAIEFAQFTDGRGYSSATLLRRRLGFEGELRAVGNVLRDQLQYMARCGIDSYALEPSKDESGLADSLQEFSVAYQGVAEDERPLFRRAVRGAGKTDSSRAP